MIPYQVTTKEANGGNGIIMTHWIKCDAASKSALVNLLNTAGPGYA